MQWRAELIERIVAAAQNGAWGYLPKSSGWAEPTALAAMALIVSHTADSHAAAALDWLAQNQRPDGAVSVSRDVDGPFWPTPLAALAWIAANEEKYAGCIQKAAQWLLAAKGAPIPPDPAIHDHDTTLIGWAWIAETHSWIEPTGYSVAALKAVGQSEHPRVREGVELILDRALPDGGWNYGNRRVLENILRPFPASTGVALVALAGEPRDAVVNKAVDYLMRELPRIRAPLSLAWAILGLRVWDATPPATESWLAEAARRMIAAPPNPHYEALLLLAGCDARLPWSNARN